MFTSQLKCGAALLLVCVAAAGCNRAQTAEETQKATDEVRNAAAYAGDRITDSWLTSKIQAQYFADADVKARFIDVSTRDGVVTLQGFVDSEPARQQAVQIAGNTDGVRKVDDQLKLGESPKTFAQQQQGASEQASDAVATAGRAIERSAETAAAKIDDARITTTIQAKYFLDTTVKARNLDVDTRAGVVTLRGDVASEDERAQALLLARNTEGVMRVEDSLRVDAALAR